LEEVEWRPGNSDPQLVARSIRSSSRGCSNDLLRTHDGGMGPGQFCSSCVLSCGACRLFPLPNAPDLPRPANATGESNSSTSTATAELRRFPSRRPLALGAVSLPPSRLPNASEKQAQANWVASGHQLVCF
jgi:hypothetical protein